MSIHFYNDKHIFKCDSFENIEDKVKGFVMIPIHYDVDAYGNVHIDSLSMKEEFERTVSGIESVIEEVSTKYYDEMES